MNASALVALSWISIMLRPTHAKGPGIIMVVTLLVMSQMFYELDAQQCIIRGEYTIRGMMLKGHTFIEEKMEIWLNCLDKCDDDVRCQSFNYVISQDICELNNRTKEARPEDFVPDSDRLYVTRMWERVSLGSVPELPAESCAEIRASEGESAISGNYWVDLNKTGNGVLVPCDMSKLDIDTCASHPCKNNGTCTDRVNGFNCSCAPGFNGTQCEIDLDDCASHPCKNNGTCTDRVNGFNCSCALGFNGTLCEKDVDDCASHPCKNNATCTDRVNGFNCSCTPGYNGIQCEKDIDDCASHPCKNNATCTDRVNGFNCSCAPGFNGTQCETDIDDCASHPCKNNGTCTDEMNRFNCSCAPGFNGTQCETDIDDCASNPCKNNGTCTDRLNAFNCSCAPGFNGTQCETDIDDCASHPCKNNGSCTDRVNGFNCSCAPGFNGTQCETDINECAAQVNPCDAVANSECKNTNGSYNCQCKDGFVRNGPNCEVDVCRGYNVLNSADRKDTYTGKILCDNKLKKGWYRFEGDAGTRMPTTCVNRGKCGTDFPGWLNSGHPTVEDGEVVREVCFHAYLDCCYDRRSIRVKNCSSYYVYKLDRTPGCDLRYCGTDSP